jgi:hypothetical protein
MPDLTSSSVVVNRAASQTLSNGLTLFTKACTVTLTTHGSASAGERILATAFGLSSVEESTPWVKTDNAEIVPAGPAADRTFLLLKAAGTAAPAATSGAYNAVLKGY